MLVTAARACLQRRVGWTRAALPRLSAALQRPTCLHTLAAIVRGFSRRSSYDNDDDDHYGEDDWSERDDERDYDDGEDMPQELGPRERARDLKGSKAERAKLKSKEKKRAKLATRLRSAKKPNKDEDDYVEAGYEQHQNTEHLEPLDLDLQQRKVKHANKFHRQPATEASESAAAAHVDPSDRLMNDAIQGDTIVLIDGNGKKIGLVSRIAALQKVRQANLDIVQLSPQSVVPPICKVVNFIEWAQAEELKARLKQSENTMLKMKTLQLRRVISPHDLETKLRQATKFIALGHPVKIVYFEPNPVATDYREFFATIADKLASVAHCDDLESNPYALFVPGERKGKARKPTKGLDVQSPQPQQQQQQPREMKQSH